MARHETYNALINTGIAYGALALVIFYFISENYRILVGGIFTFIFWVTVIVYFGWDYRKNHEKREIIKLLPLTSEKKQWVKSHPKSTKIIKRKTVEQLKRLLEFHPKPTKLAFAISTFFFALEVVEALILLAFPISQWQVLTAITYQNAYLIGFFVVGILLTSDVIRRLYHLKKYHSD